tara:strand:- start:190 stop:615 length:426 start_codon:yes stop_codon:yes gene_type:complete
MNNWIIDNQYNIDYIFNNVRQFIYNYNIALRINIDSLYYHFNNLAYKTSHKPFISYNYSYYNINNKHIQFSYNNYETYDLNIGSNFFDILHDSKVYIQEYNNMFLARLHTHSLQNFFENFFMIQDLEKNIEHNDMSDLYDI